MEKKMSDEEMLEAMEQAVKMHFMAFQQFMKQERIMKDIQTRRRVVLSGI